MLIDVLIAPAAIIPPVVFIVVMAPVGLKTVPNGFGLAVVGFGTKANPPDAESVVICAPPMSIVLPLIYNVLNLSVGLPMSYVMFALGSICPVVRFPAKLPVPPTFNAPPTPAPPATTKAPVVVLVLVVVPVILAALPMLTLPETDASPDTVNGNPGVVVPIPTLPAK